MRRGSALRWRRVLGGGTYVLPPGPQRLRTGAGGLRRSPTTRARGAASNLHAPSYSPLMYVGTEQYGGARAAEPVGAVTTTGVGFHTTKCASRAARPQGKLRDNRACACMLVTGGGGAGRRR